MKHQATDDMMYLCAEDGSLTLTGRELREYNAQKGQRPISPVESAGRVLHAWEMTDRNGNVEYTEYTTTQGYLISNGEIVTDSGASVEVDPRTGILPPDRLRNRVQGAKDDTSFNGLKKSYSESELNGLERNAEQLAQIVATDFDISLSTLFTGVWESAQPYLVGRDYQYRVPLKGEDNNIRDQFTNRMSAIDQLSQKQISLLWDAVVPVLIVDIDLYIDGELVS